jgi:diguanylate cyclase (GGDEF)-like protein
MEGEKMIFDELTSAYTSSGFHSAAHNFFLKKGLQGILIISLDELKRINHLNGKHIGDALLRMVVRDVYNTIPHALVGRIDNNEFAVFLPNIENERKLAGFAQSIVESARSVRQIQGVSVLCTVTVGAVTIRRAECENKTFDDLMSLAEFALSDGKSAGGNRYVMYNEDMVKQYKRTDDIKIELQKIINDDNALYKYQPIVNMKTHKIGGFEMLARMASNGFANVSPAEFIHIARENNMIHYFDIAAIKTACGSLKRLADAGMGDIYISVNVSPEFFLSDGFFEKVKEVALGAEIDLKTLVIELTEDTFISSYNRTKEIIDKLNKMGIRFYVDDFGTGYSNLSRLQELNMAALKIDKSLVDKLEKNDSLIRKTIEIARIFDMKVVAEGIETKSQLDHLESIGCDMGQGYFIGKPMVFEDMKEFIRKQL